MARVGNIRNFSKEQFADAVVAGAVYVGRPSYFGNPFVLKDPQNDEQRLAVLKQYWAWLNEDAQLQFRNEVRRQLAGKDLICWCAPKHCHAQALVKIAESPLEEAKPKRAPRKAAASKTAKPVQQDSTE